MLLTDEVIDRLQRFRIRTMLASRDLGYKVAEIGGGAARFAGAGSPVTQTYGVGFRGAAVDLKVLDEFYQGLADNWELIVTPFDSPEVFQQAVTLGYVPDHFETVMGMIAGEVETPGIPDLTIEERGEGDELWIKTSEAGWMELPELPEQPSEFGRQMAKGGQTRRFLAYWKGEPAATAAILGSEGDFLLAGACTRTQFRGLGIQKALGRHRLRVAGPGSFVQVVTLPGSASHRNAQRTGFSPLYSKLVMMRRLPN